MGQRIATLVVHARFRNAEKASPAMALLWRRTKSSLIRQAPVLNVAVAASGHHILAAEDQPGG
ncbi:MAG: hypothetical protein U0350_09515 [Caldilineaceae bacterium]